MTVWAFGGHWMQKTLDFKLLLDTCEIDLFTYPTLTKHPAEIVLPGCEWQQTLSYMTWEHIGTIKLIKNIIKSDIHSLFCQIWYKTEHFFKIKNHTQKNIINFNFFSVELCWHTLCYNLVNIWWSLDAKNTWFQAYVTNLWNWPFHLPHPL